MSKYLISAYMFYKWNNTDTLNSVLDKSHDGEDTIHTEVSFYSDKIVLRKTDCKIFDAKKHRLEFSPKYFAYMMNQQDWNKSLYDWEVIQ
tara:strand:+ start:276 stop:545 length:270 start_codon:yes stop_codon:yes gene_type:complete